MKLSVIIPTYNEAENIGKLVSYLLNAANGEKIQILIADGGSNDNTIEEAASAGAEVLLSPRKGRASQMNYAASEASGKILYFLHADSYPPDNFYSEIIGSITAEINSGCFRLKFDYRHWFLNFNAWFTRFDNNLIRFGDQSLFVKKEDFIKSGGFREDLIVMEDQEIVHRIKKFGKFKVLKGPITTSARKYLENGIYKLQGIFFLIYLMYWLGFSQEKMIKVYKILIRQNKV